MPKKISEELKDYIGQVCAYMKKTSHVLMKEDKEELYKRFGTTYKKRTIDAILSGIRYNGDVTHWAQLLIDSRCAEIYALGKENSKIRTKIRRIAKKGLL